jgi:hypothetical protein
MDLWKLLSTQNYFPIDIWTLLEHVKKCICNKKNVLKSTVILYTQIEQRLLPAKLCICLLGGACILLLCDYL